MRKKLTLMFVALLAMAAFAATQALNQARRAPETVVTYEKVTSLDKLTTGDYLIVCESKGVAFNGGLDPLDAVGNTIEVTPTDGVIESSDAVDAAVFTIDVATGYIKSKSGFYIGSANSATSTSNGLKQNATPKDFWNNAFSFDDEGNAVIIVNNEMALRYNAGSSQLRFRYFKNNGGTQEKIQLYKKVESEAASGGGTLVYDFEAAAAAEENPDNFNGNQNNGQGFFGWEKADKTDSRRNDYKGYANYTGTNLPAECHVWRRSDRINGNVKDGGLYCPNDREMAIDGLVPGATVTIIYDATNAAEGSKELIWAMGDGTTKTDGVEAGTRTSAIINGVAAVSGKTAIPSGTKIRVNPIIPAVKGTGYIVVKVWKKMVIKKIIINLPASAVYDFKAAEEAGENPENLNGSAAKGQAFYVWESANKADSKRQDFKGYQNYTGTNLPAECHVWRRSDRINNNVKNGGLYCPSDKEMVIDGLTAGSIVKIEYDATNAADGSKEIIWATGTGAEPNTLAVVGSGTTSAVSGITPIPSGAVIHIVSTDKGYFGFKVKKNMVITKITVDVETPIQNVKKGYGVFISDGFVNGAVSVDKFAAAEGETVTIVPAPEEDYSLVKVVVVDAEGNEVPVVDNKTFVMPASNVTIQSAAFKKVKDLELTLLEPCNISKAVKDELGADGVANNLTINLAFSTNYTITEPLVAAGSVKLIGDNSIIDASSLSDALIKMYENPIADRLNNTDYYGIDSVLIQNVVLNNVKNSIFWDNNVKYCVKNFIIDKSLIKLATNAVKGNAIIAFEAGGAKDYAVKNSTVYNTTATTAMFLQYQADASLRRYGYNGVDDTWSFTYKNNTFYNVARDKNNYLSFEEHWGVYDDASAQAAVFDVQDNIFYNCGDWANTGGMILGWRDKGAYKSVTFVHNTYWWTTGENDERWYWSSNDYYTGEYYIMKTSPKFADPKNGDFTLGIGDKQQKYETGDPRWLTYYDPAFAEVENVNLNLTDGAEISSALANEIYKQGIDKLGAIEINLGPGAYTIENTIEAPNAFALWGNMTFGLNDRVTIDASKLDGPFVLMSKEPTLNTNEKGAYVGGYVRFMGVDINNLKQQLVYANKTQYLLDHVLVGDCVINIDGTAKKTIFDFNGGGNTRVLAVENATLWANPTNGQNGGFFSSQSSKDVRELDEEATQEFYILRSTLYNITNGKTVSTLRKNSQEYQKYYVYNNIVVDCGKSAQFLKGLNAGQAGKDVNWEVDGNVFNFGGAISAEQQIGSTEENIKNTIEVLVNFADVEKGDFRQGGVETAGDPRWYDASIPTAIEEVKTNADKYGDGAWYTIQGVRIDKPAKGMYIHNGRKVIVK